MAVSPYTYGGGLPSPVKKPVPKPQAPPKPPHASDPSGSAQLLFGLPVSTIARMTPEQLAIWQTAMAAQGPNYAAVPKVDFTKLQNAAWNQAGTAVTAAAAPYQALRDQNKAQLATSNEAAKNFALAFAGIAGGGNANIDSPQAQAYSLQNFGGSYVGGMAATIGAQLMGMQASAFTAADMSYATKMADIMAQRPDIAHQIYTDVADAASTNVKNGIDAANLSYENGIKAIASLISVKQKAASGGQGRTAKVGGSLYTQNADGSWSLAIQGPPVAGKTVKGVTIGDTRYRTNPDGTLTPIQKLPGVKTGVSATSVGPALKRAQDMGSQALSGVYDRIWAKGYVAAGSPPPFLGKDANGNGIPNPEYAKVLAWAAGMKTRAFKTAMTRVVTSISGQLKPLGYTTEQIRAEAYRIITTVGDSVHHSTITPPQGFVAPKAKNVSFTPTDAAAPAIQAAATQIGKPYQFGSGPDTKTFDCSDLIQWAYGQMGIKLPRDTYGQIKAGVPVTFRSVSDLLPGDLIFPEKGHVVMYVGDGKVIAAPHTGTVVQYQDVGMFVPPVAVRRIVTGGTSV